MKSSRAISRDGPQNVGSVWTSDAADSPRRLHQINRFPAFIEILIYIIHRSRNVPLKCPVRSGGDVFTSS
jgi:hypothetical protein